MYVRQNKHQHEKFPFRCVLRGSLNEDREFGTENRRRFLRGEHRGLRACGLVGRGLDLGGVEGPLMDPSSYSALSNFFSGVSFRRVLDRTFLDRF